MTDTGGHARDVEVMVVPYDSGHRARRMGAGPARLLDEGLERRLQEAGSSVKTTPIELPDNFFPAEPAAAFALHRVLARAVGDASSRNAFPLILAGNCNTCLGTISGLRVPDIGIVWFDAHGDFNTPETTPSGFFDGMALAAATGRCWKEATSFIPGFHPVEDRRIVHLGARDFDIGENAMLAASKVEVVPAKRVRQGLSAIFDARKSHTRDVYLHLDLDVLDIGEGKVNAYSIAGGLTAEEIRNAIGEIGSAFRIRAAGITAYDPAFDSSGDVARIAVDLAVSIVEAGGHED
ncbi:MAG: arginase family protein [Gemmatimonadales bacterium]